MATEPASPIRFRKLRIAFSVTCLIACVLLIALWVRSYNRTETVSTTNKNLISTTFGSGCGLAYFIRSDDSAVVFGDPFEDAEESGWKYSSVPAAPGPPHKLSWNSDAKLLIVPVPYWCSVLLAAALALAPWLRPRFSLRTLLIATTLVAVVLGLAVYAGRIH
jgi:hypothetical protein